MLELITNVFNFLGRLITFTYLCALIIGKFVFHIILQIISIVYNILISIINCAIIIYDELVDFLRDILDSTTGILNGVKHAIQNTFNNLGFLTETTWNEINEFISSSRLKIQNMVSTTFTLRDGFISNAIGAILLIGDIAWSLMSAVPRLIIFLVSFLLFAVFELISGITKIILNCIQSVRNLPLHSIAGLLLIAIVVKYKDEILFLLDVSLSPYLRRIQGGTRRFYFSFLNWAHDFFRLDSDNGGQNINASDTYYKEPNTLCVICQERLKSVVLLPCKHLCVCVECSNSIEYYHQSCPLCRVNIQSKMTVYI